MKDLIERAEEALERAIPVIADVRHTETTHTRNAGTDWRCREWFVDHGDVFPDLARLAVAAGELAEACANLDKSVSEVARLGAQTGSQWSRLTIASLKHRAALARFRAIAEASE